MDNVSNFENLISEFYGAPYGVAVDCCTHGIELCLRFLEIKKTSCPRNTYLSIPMTFEKLGIEYEFTSQKWKDFYILGDTNILDAAVYWKEKSYIPNTFMVLSFQFKKHLGLGRGGMILTDSINAAEKLKKMSYDGRIPNIPWAEQNVDMLGYHYYMTPETAKDGIEKFPLIKNLQPKNWSYKDYPDLSLMEIFK